MDRKQTVKHLEEMGLMEDKDYFIENIFMLTTHFDSMSIIEVSESDYENDDYDAWSKAEIQDKLHEEKEIISFQLLDMDFKKITLDKLTEHCDPLKPNGINNCGICAKPIVKTRGFSKDQREVEGKLRCFDHIGEPEIQFTNNNKGESP